MPTLPRHRIRIAADATSFDSPVEAQRNLTPAFWRGADLQFEFGLFHNDTLIDVSNLATLTVEVKPLAQDNGAPADGTTPLMSNTVTTFDNTLDLFTWADSSKAHATVPFTAAETALEPGLYWLVVTATTTDNPAHGITFTAGRIEVLQSGAAATEVAPLLEPYGYTQAQADDRFLNVTTHIQRDVMADSQLHGAPSGSYRILAIAVRETAGQAVTGLRISPASGGDDVVSATDLPASTDPPVDLVGTQTVFNAPLYLSADNWNSASIDLQIDYQPLSL